MRRESSLNGTPPDASASRATALQRVSALRSKPPWRRCKRPPYSCWLDPNSNSQPHEVRCKTHLYGAHNGNVTNCDALKAWLTSEGHVVRSDNDGEMVVHAVEHYFAQTLSTLPAAEQRDPATRRRCMRAAIGLAAARLEGSFAAIIVDPVTRVVWAIKLGSSLYFGFGRDEVGGGFGLASSDLSSVLKLTRVLVPIVEGELVEFEPGGFTVWGLRRGTAGDPVRLEREPVRSRLRAEDTALLPPFETFMEQEIAAQEPTVRNVVNLFCLFLTLKP
jgi:glucosamine--fructose-6-phosphate aminotransferase (isomerizing)